MTDFMQKQNCIKAGHGHYFVWKSGRTEVCSNCGERRPSDIAESTRISLEQAAEEMYAWAQENHLGTFDFSKEMANRLKRLAGEVYENRRVVFHSYVFCFMHNRAAADEQGCDSPDSAECDISMAHIYRMDP